MNNAICVGLAILGWGVVLIGWALASAPEGYEDANGWHRGKVPEGWLFDEDTGCWYDPDMGKCMPCSYTEVLSGVKCTKCGGFIGNWE